MNQNQSSATRNCEMASRTISTFPSTSNSMAQKSLSLLVGIPLFLLGPRDIFGYDTLPWRQSPKTRDRSWVDTSTWLTRKLKTPNYVTSSWIARIDHLNSQVHRYHSFRQTGDHQVMYTTRRYVNPSSGSNASDSRTKKDTIPGGFKKQIGWECGLGVRYHSYLWIMCRGSTS